MNEIYEIIIGIRTVLMQGKEGLLASVRRGVLPAIQQIKERIFKTRELLSHTKRLCVQVIQF